ncbi:type II toxin-antitoxin system RelE/ParE family toxin [Mycobacterium sp.]|uniref:type II toxin-antitoxin system RelE family toxin n=1 Tax=Mycobacterium sp. TaxID=1785 RepID=UPI0031DF81C6
MENVGCLCRPPTKIRDAALATLHGPLRENPRRRGTALVGELAGVFSARRGGYRIIYSIDATAKVVMVHRIAHRASVCRRGGRGSARRRRR